MRHSNRIFLLALCALGAASGNGCGSASATGGLEGGSSGRQGRIAESGQSAQQPYDGPPHVFTPRSHSPRSRFAPPSPNLGAMPPLKLRLGECFGLRDKEEAQIATGAIKPHRGRNGGSKKTASKSSGPGAPKVKAPSVAQPSKANAGGVSGGAAVTPPRTDQGDVLLSSPGSKMADSSKAERKQEKKRAEKQKSDAYAQPAPAAESAAPSAAPALSAPAADEEPGGWDKSSREGETRIATSEPEPAPLEPSVPDYNDWGASIYLSNDDTMSLSSAQRVIFAIDNFLPLPLEHVRPHELLNYFGFETASVEPESDFSVLADIEPDPRQAGIYTLGLAVRGRSVDTASRRNAALTLVIDRSGSMSDEGRMSYLKRGLARMLKELKTGDMVHMVIFDHEVCAPVENFVVGRDDIGQLQRAIGALEPRGSTDLHQGLALGYQIADRAYLAEHSNRVLLITDALANTGVTDEQTISMISKYFDTRRIRLSGVGVGREFNDALLDGLTERGKGAYVFLGSEAEVDAVFGSRFVSLIETTALNVHFLLRMPPSLRMNVFYGEESSTVKEDVQEIHYFANTAQLFLSDLMARGGTLRPQDGIMLSIDYEDPESGDKLYDDYAFRLEDIAKESYNVRKGRMIMAWIDLLTWMAARPVPSVYQYGIGSWIDGEGWQRCEDGRAELARLRQGLEKDRESTRVIELWDKHCSRYERPRNPVKRQIAAPPESSWPAAQPNSPRR